MAHCRFPKLLLFGLFLFVISGCAYPISKELRQEARKDLTFSMVLQNPTAYIGSIVLRGGKIIETFNVADGTEIIVLETPLDYEEMPEAAKYSHGRFIAKSSKFLDPEIYKKGKKITVAGEVLGEKMRSLGEIEYRYPLLLGKQIHLWRRYYRRYPSPYFPEYPWGDYANDGSMVVAKESI